MKEIVNNLDLIVQFSQLWGMEIMNAVYSFNKTKANIMKEWQSDELAELFVEWVDEYMKSDIEDSCDFFSMKLKALIIEQS